VALLLGLAPGVARADFMGAPFLGPQDMPTGPFAGFGVFAGSPTNSYTRVRENADRGTYLYLKDDLGVFVDGETSLQLGWRFDADDALGFALNYVFIGGGRRIPKNIEYNATTLQGGTQLAEDPTSVHWFAFELQYERTILRFMDEDRGLLAAVIGVRYDDIDWRFTKQTIAATSAGAEAGEDFRTQSIPTPVLGLVGRIPITTNWDVVLAARGFRFNHVSSGRSEGGLVYISESVIEATAGFAVRVSPGASWNFGYRFLYVDFDGESREDGNLIGLFTHGIYFTFQVTF
jgi:hypothetical protein